MGFPRCLSPWGHKVSDRIEVTEHAHRHYIYESYLQICVDDYFQLLIIYRLFLLICLVAIGQKQ